MEETHRDMACQINDKWHVPGLKCKFKCSNVWHKGWPVRQEYEQEGRVFTHSLKVRIKRGLSEQNKMTSKIIIVVHCISHFRPHICGNPLMIKHKLGLSTYLEPQKCQP